MELSGSNPRPTLFWDVDTQVDFLLPGGKLYVAGAERIIPTLGRLTRYARDHDILVVASTDAHKPDDAEFRQWPPHCLLGTAGQRKVPETELRARYVVPNAPAAIPQELDRFEQVIIEKQTLDVFSNPNIEKVLQRLGRRDVVLYGVVTEICVAIAARGLLDRGYRVAVVTDAVRALDEAEGRAFLEYVQRRGGQLRAADEVLRRRAA